MATGEGVAALVLFIMSCGIRLMRRWSLLVAMTLDERHERHFVTTKAKNEAQVEILFVFRWAKYPVMQRRAVKKRRKRT